MAGTLAREGAPQTPEEPGRYKDMRAGIINVTNDRLGKLSADQRHHVASVDYDLSGRDDVLLTSIVVGRPTDDGVLPVTFKEPGFVESIRIGQDGELEGLTPESTLPIEFANDVVRRLDMMAEAPATATVVTNYAL